MGIKIQLYFPCSNPDNTGMSQQALLFVNLGSPLSYDVNDVKAYLKEFLMDPYVLDIPYLLRWFVVQRILKTRPPETAEAYREVWTKNGAPLIVLSQQLMDLIAEKIKVPIALGMRYAEPSIDMAICDLLRRHPSIEQIKLIPLYPHYALSSTETVIAKTKRVLAKRCPHVKLTWVASFFDHPAYIAALADRLQKSLPSDYDAILFSYHGLPERHIMKSDPTASHCQLNEACCQTPSEAHKTCYVHQVKQTTRLLVQACNLEPKKMSLAFQSRLGKDPWVRPYTDEEVMRLVEKGVKRLVVISPSFVADCLETIEELGMRLKEDFLKAGGESFTLIPCLNTDQKWVDALAQIAAD